MLSSPSSLSLTATDLSPPPSAPLPPQALGPSEFISEAIMDAATLLKLQAASGMGMEDTQVRDMGVWEREEMGEGGRQLSSCSSSFVPSLTASSFPSRKSPSQFSRTPSPLITDGG
jgi:hypothetical protein